MRCRDERASYADALAQHHEFGTTPGWESAYVGGYATMHPLGDWAETLGPLSAYGRSAQYRALLAAQHRHCRGAHRDSASGPGPLSAEFVAMVREWTPLTLVANSPNRSLGHEDAYPSPCPFWRCARSSSCTR